MYTEQIAKLYGTLEWHVNNSGLKQFQRALDRVQNSLKPLQDAVAKAESKLNGVGKAAAAQREKLDGRKRHSLNRELQLETALTNVKRAQFAATLKQSKLTYTGNKEASNVATAGIRDQQLLFAQLAKQQRKADMSAETARIKQLRLTEMLKQQQARTVLLEQRRVNLMTGAQKIEHQIQQLRERGQRQAIEFQARQASRAAAERRKDVVDQQRTERHRWALQRQQAWERRQEERQNNNNGMGIFALSGLGPIAGIGAAVYSLQAVINRLGDRLEQSQTRASDAEQFQNVLDQAGGQNPDNRKFIKDQFLRIGQEYGSAIDLPAAQEFRKFILAQTSIGATLTKAVQVFETQVGAFTAAGMTAQQSERANYQLNQIRAKGMPEGADVNDLFDSAPVIAPYIRQAYADRVKLKLPAGKLAARFKEDVSKKKVVAADFEKGLENFLKANMPALEKQKQSIAAESQRLENEKTLQTLRLYGETEINSAVRQRIQSEKELVVATEDLKRSMMGFDTWLNKQTVKLYEALSGSRDTPNTDRFNNKQSGIRLNPRLNPGATLERNKRDEMLANRPISLEAPQQEANPAFGELGKALLSFADRFSPQGKALLMANQDQAPAAAIQALKQTFNNNNENHIDASVTFGDVVVNVPNFISGPEELANVIGDKIRDDFGQHHEDAMQTIYRRAMINAAEGKK
ncbi:tape measure protein [Pseudomonas sp. PSE14]|uniref:tape measure protein n=1 Tax=Pseudomonas sp. PSE14 TaxID=3016341 RepID=UPI0023D82F23|nr:tape measure protein [Pseudomonas sp. PSE14]WEJ70448.1 tape measure protein [Pseudomonas sp. PSE14]